MCNFCAWNMSMNGLWYPVWASNNLLNSHSGWCDIKLQANSLLLNFVNIFYRYDLLQWQWFLTSQCIEVVFYSNFTDFFSKGRIDNNQQWLGNFLVLNRWQAFNQSNDVNHWHIYMQDKHLTKNSQGHFIFRYQRRSDRHQLDIDPTLLCRIDI